MTFPVKRKSILRNVLEERLYLKHQLDWSSKNIIYICCNVEVEV